MHIGGRIREVLLQRKMTVTDFAKALSCTRENAHRILGKRNIDVEKLIQISRILSHDFFQDISNCNHFYHCDENGHTA